MKFRAGRRRARSPASASTSATATPGTHLGSPVVAAPAPSSAHGHLHRRDGQRLAAGHLRDARSRSPPDTTYVASYYAPIGRYSVSRATSRPRRPTTAPLTRPAGRSVRRQRRLPLRRAGGGFPNPDVRVGELLGRRRLHRRRTTPPRPTVTTRTPGAGATGVPLGGHVTATFSEPVQQSTRSRSSCERPAARRSRPPSYDAASRTATLHPDRRAGRDDDLHRHRLRRPDTAGNQMASTHLVVHHRRRPTRPSRRSPAAPRPSAPPGSPLGASPTATFTEAVQQATIAFELRGPGNALVPATTTLRRGHPHGDPRRRAARSPAARPTPPPSAARGTRRATRCTPVTWSFTTTAGTTGCPCTHLGGHRHARRAPTPTPARSSSGVKFRASDGRLRHRHPLLQAHADQRRPRRVALEQHRQPARARSPSPARRPAAGSRRPSPADRRHGRDDLRRVLLHAVGRYAVDARRYFASAATARGPLHGAAERHRRRQRPVPVHRDRRARSPTRRSARRTTGSTWSSRTAPRLHQAAPSPRAPARRCHRCQACGSDGDRHVLRDRCSSRRSAS